MAISKTAAPCRMEVVWDSAGTVTGVSVTYFATFTDSTTGTAATFTKVIPITPGAGFLSAMASIYAALPSSGL